MEEERVMRTEKEKNPFQSFVQSQIYFLKLIYKEHPKSFIFFSLLALLSSVLPPVLVFVNKEAIDAISSVAHNPDVLKVAVLLLIAYFAIQYLSGFLDHAKEYVFNKIQYTVNYVLKRMVTNKCIHIPMKEYEDSVFYDTLNLSNMAISGNGVKVVQNIISIFGGILSLSGIFGILWTIHWSLPLALFLSTLPGIIVVFISKFKSYRMHLDVSAKERELGYTDGLFTTKSTLKEINIYGIGHFLIDKWAKLFKHVQERNLSVAFWEFKTQVFAALILQAASFGVSLFLVYRMFGGDLTIGSYVALLTAVTTVQGLFGSIGGNLGNIFETAIYNSALLKVLNYEVKQTDQTARVDIHEINELSLENATFYYPKSSAKVLDDVSLKINKGENISIVGYNGSGKTTLAHCILGMYDLDSGTMKVNGINITDITEESYFKRVSAIFQDFNRYKYSVRENIGYGDLTKLQDDQELYDALHKVGLLEKVKTYDHSLDTYLTKELPEGSELSGGEWQRLAIARAFLKPSDLIILDEPTAALDPITELNIFDLFHKVSKGKTTITISHRIGPTRFSDRIIVMDKGKIVEEGDFNALMSRRGLYYEMYASQAKWYESNAEETVKSWYFS